MSFSDRRNAGRQLARRLKGMGLVAPVVIGLPRGGVPVAAEVADALGAPLDVWVTRKIGAPGNPEFAIGAVAEDGTLWINPGAEQGLSEGELDRLARAEEEAATEQARLIRRGRPILAVMGRTVVLVDDGLATGATARAAILSLGRRGAARMILAVPVGAPESLREIERWVEAGDARNAYKDPTDVVCLEEPKGFYSVGEWYRDFSPVSDEEVTRLLQAGAGRMGGSEPSSHEIVISDGVVHLPGILRVPPGASGIVIFAHGSGSSRLSTRNQEVARELNLGGMATLLFDLLEAEEALDRDNVFDIRLLASRLILADSLIRQRPETADLPVGFFGASTGSAAALWAAGTLKRGVSAIVSRGGRPDLASKKLAEVTAPTLLIVGGADAGVIDLNRSAHDELAHSKLLIIPGATHLFEEPGALKAVSRAAREWFHGHFAVQAAQKAA